MNKSKPIQIFKAGKHTAMSGIALSFSEIDLAATAKAYDPAKHEAPFVCGHPAHDAPAYGWVASLSFADGALEAQPTQVNADFAELVASGAFKKISASFYAPDSPSNPEPGVFYLRHVGLLGAMPPAVKGLRTPSFADSEQGVVEFGEWDDVTNASLWRRLRDWFISEKGLPVADSIIPDYQVASLEQAAQDEVREAQQESQTNIFPSPAFSEKENQVTPEQKAALEAENLQLKTRLAESEARDKAGKLAAISAANASFAEGLVADGKLLPVQKDVVIATLNQLSTPEQVVEFGEGDAKKPLVDALKSVLSTLPKVVNFGEYSAAINAEQVSSVEFAAPRGAEVNKEQLELHHKALAYMEQHQGVEYLNAVKAVGGK